MIIVGVGVDENDDDEDDADDADDDDDADSTEVVDEADGNGDAVDDDDDAEGDDDEYGVPSPTDADFPPRPDASVFLGVASIFFDGNVNDDDDDVGLNNTFSGLVLFFSSTPVFRLSSLCLTSFLKVFSRPTCFEFE